LWRNVTTIVVYMKHSSDDQVKSVKLTTINYSPVCFQLSDVAITGRAGLVKIRLC
jgi:hypothetical protein